MCFTLFCKGGGITTPPENGGDVETRAFITVLGDNKYDIGLTVYTIPDESVKSLDATFTLEDNTTKKLNLPITYRDADMNMCYGYLGNIDVSSKLTNVTKIEARDDNRVVIYYNPVVTVFEHKNSYSGTADLTLGSPDSNDTYSITGTINLDREVEETDKIAGMTIVMSQTDGDITGNWVYGGLTFNGTEVVVDTTITAPHEGVEFIAIEGITNFFDEDNNAVAVLSRVTKA